MRKSASTSLINAFIEGGVIDTVKYEPGKSVLLHYRGTVLPRVWQRMLFCGAFAFICCTIYEPLRMEIKRETQLRQTKGPRICVVSAEQKFYYHMFEDAEEFLKYCSTFITFILGFFNSVAFSRWWKLRDLCGAVSGLTTDTTVMIATYVSEGDERKREKTRAKLLRYLALAQATQLLAARKVDEGETEKGKVEIDKLVQRGLLAKDGPEYVVLIQALEAGTQVTSVSSAVSPLLSKAPPVVCCPAVVVPLTPSNPRSVTTSCTAGSCIRGYTRSWGRTWYTHT